MTLIFYTIEVCKGKKYFSNGSEDFPKTLGDCPNDSEDLPGNVVNLPWFLPVDWEWSNGSLMLKETSKAKDDR